MRMRAARIAIVLIAFQSPGAALAQITAPARGDVVIEKYLAHTAAKLSRRVLDGARTREEWEARRPRLRQEFLDMLGL